MVSIVPGTIGILAAITIILLIRRDKLHVRFGLWWIAVALAFIVFGFFPWLFDNLAASLGIAYGPVLALTLGLTVLFIKVLTMDIARSKSEARIVRLVQRVAMLEADLQALQDKHGSPVESDANTSREHDTPTGT